MPKHLGLEIRSHEEQVLKENKVAFRGGRQDAAVGRVTIRLDRTTCPFAEAYSPSATPIDPEMKRLSKDALRHCLCSSEPSQRQLSTATKVPKSASAFASAIEATGEVLVAKSINLHEGVIRLGTLAELESFRA